MRYLFLILTFNLFTGNFLKSQILNDSLINAYLILEDEGSAKQILNFKIKDQTNSPETMNSLLFQKGIIYMKTGQVDSALSNFNSVFLNTYKTKSTELFFQSFQKVLELNDLKSDTISIRKTIEIFIHVDLTDTSSLWYFYSVFWQKKLEKPSLIVFKEFEKIFLTAKQNGFVQLQFETSLALAETAHRLGFNSISYGYLRDAVHLADSIGDLEIQVKSRGIFMALCESVHDARMVSWLKADLDSLELKSENELKSARLKAIEIIRKSADLAQQKSLNELLNQNKSEISKIEQAGFTRRLFLLLLVFIFIFFFAFYFFRSMRFRKRLGVKADSEKKLMLEIEELQEQITEFVTSSDELIKYNLQNEKEGAVLKSKIKALNELIEQSKQDVSGLLKRLNDLQTVYHDSEGMFKRLYPEATFQALALNGLYYHFFACSELRLLKPGKMFAAKGDAELSGVGESSEIFILFGAVTNNYLESALDNLWLQQIAITVMSDKKNRSIERIRDGFLLQIKMANFPEVNFSILKLNRENRTIEFSFHGNPLFIFDGKKGSQITQSISSSILSATSRIGISTNGNETAARILTEIVTDPNTDIDEQLQSIKDITGVWVKIPVI